MTSTEKPLFYDDLEGTRLEAWKLLTRGVADRRSAFHTPAIVTLGLDGAPRVRTVVLRAAEPSARLLRFHTDARSGKVAEIARDPRVGVHVYDARSKIQVRLDGVARVHPWPAQRAQAAWDASRPQSRSCYAQALAPAAAIATPHEGEAREGEGVENFNIVEVEVTAIEWLYLFHAGHRRARFVWEGQNTQDDAAGAAQGGGATTCGTAWGPTWRTSWLAP